MLTWKISPAWHHISHQGSFCWTNLTPRLCMVLYLSCHLSWMGNFWKNIVHQLYRSWLSRITNMSCKYVRGQVEEYNVKVNSDLVGCLFISVPLNNKLVLDGLKLDSSYEKLKKLVRYNDGKIHIWEYPPELVLIWRIFSTLSMSLGFFWF